MDRISILEVWVEVIAGVKDRVKQAQVVLGNRIYKIQPRMKGLCGGEVGDEVECRLEP